MHEKFSITGEYIELIKLLKATGLCQTGGMAKIMIENGEVQVNGSPEFRKRNKIKRGFIVEFDGNTVEVV